MKSIRLLLCIAGIPSIKLEVSEKNVFVEDDRQEISWKTSCLFFRACYEKTKLEDFKSTFIKAKASCLKVLH